MITIKHRREGFWPRIDRDDTDNYCQIDEWALYAVGAREPNYPVPAIVCATVWFPKGNPFVDPPDVPYINLVKYNGFVSPYGIGYEIVRRYWC